MSLLEAVQDINYELLKELIEESTDVNADVNAIDKNGFTLLTNAISPNMYTPSTLNNRYGVSRKDICELLINNGANINEKSKVPYMWEDKGREITSTMTPLEYACYRNNTDIVELLINKGAKIEDYQLFRSIKHKNKKMCTLLIENGANVNSLHPAYHTTPLKYAIIRKAEKEICELLIQKGAKYDETYLLTSAEYNRKDICELLVEYDVELTISKKYFIEYCTRGYGSGDYISYDEIKTMIMNHQKNT